MLSLNVKELFVSFQGEGINFGKPALFIRLAGCNLSCPWCDTDYGKPFDSVRVLELRLTIYEILKNAPEVKHLVITGGEPAIQFEAIGSLFGNFFLDNTSYTIDIESNGLILPPWDSVLGRFRLNLTVSPKLDFIDKYVKAITLPTYASVKVVVSMEEATDFRDTQKKLDDLFINLNKVPVFLQPLEEGKKYKDKIKTMNKIALKLAENKMYGYRLSYQVHKLLGVE